MVTLSLIKVDTGAFALSLAETGGSRPMSALRARGHRDARDSAATATPGESADPAARGALDAGEGEAVFVGPDDAVIVPPDEETAARSALATGEPLTQEALEELLEGVPPAAEELVHVESPLEEVLLDEGPPFEPPADDEVELAWADATDPDGAQRDGMRG